MNNVMTAKRTYILHKARSLTMTSLDKYIQRVPYGHPHFKFHKALTNAFLDEIILVKTDLCYQERNRGRLQIINTSKIFPISLTSGDILYIVTDF